jgi:hypothetical protein
VHWALRTGLWTPADYCDGDLTTEVKHIEGGYHALLRSSFAFTFGIIPEVTATIMILICGVQCILWSGSKVGSDTHGLEEIILATVVIVLINEIDDAGRVVQNSS